jgi:hypothetical protein
MNWGKGFFRSWIVLSGLWLSAVAALGFLDLSSKFYPGGAILAGKTISPAFEKYSKEGRALSEAEREGQVRSFTVDKIPEVSIYVPTSLSDDERAKRLSAATQVAAQAKDTFFREKRWISLKQYSLAAVLPPAVVFLIGFALLWAIRGFLRGS